MRICHKASIYWLFGSKVLFFFSSKIREFAPPLIERTRDHIAARAKVLYRWLIYMCLGHFDKIDE